MPTWIALPRGINLGPRNKVPMARLRNVLADHGFTDVRTHLQTGNILLSSPECSESDLASRLEKLIDDEFSVATTVVMRTADEFVRVVESCPFDENDGNVHVIFLDRRPEPERVAELAARDWDGDAIQVVDREAYACYQESMHRSRLQHEAILKHLDCVGTARNLRTVQAVGRKILETR